MCSMFDFNAGDLTSPLVIDLQFTSAFLSNVKTIPNLNQVYYFFRCRLGNNYDTCSLFNYLPLLHITLSSNGN